VGFGRKERSGDVLDHCSGTATASIEIVPDERLPPKTHPQQFLSFFTAPHLSTY
jgi:hypothetical protein